MLEGERPNAPAQAKRSFPAREARKLETRQRIIDAALQCFSESGFRAVSVDDIARQAGTHRKTFYLHFSSIADLARSVATQIEPEAVAVLQSLDGMKEPTPDRIRRWLDEMRALYAKHATLIDVIDSAMSSEPTLAAESARFAAFYTSTMDRYLSSFTGRPRRAAQQRLLLMHLLLERYFYYSALRKVELGGEGMERTLAEVIHQILFAPGKSAGRR